MPIETRTLLFNRDELKVAAHEEAVRKEMASEADRVVDLDVRPEAEGIVVARLSGSNETPVSVELSYADMIAALILFCRERQIPLPRGGDKRLTPAGDGMALMVRMVFGRQTA